MVSRKIQAGFAGGMIALALVGCGSESDDVGVIGQCPENYPAAVLKNATQVENTQEAFMAIQGGVAELIAHEHTSGLYPDMIEHPSESAQPALKTLLPHNWLLDGYYVDRGNSVDRLSTAFCTAVVDGGSAGVYLSPTAATAVAQMGAAGVEVQINAPAGTPTAIASPSS